MLLSWRGMALRGAAAKRLTAIDADWKLSRVTCGSPLNCDSPCSCEATAAAPPAVITERRVLVSRDVNSTNGTSRGRAPHNRIVRFLRMGGVMGRTFLGYKAISLAEKVRGL